MGTLDISVTQFMISFCFSRLTARFHGQAMTTSTLYDILHQGSTETTVDGSLVRKAHQSGLGRDANAKQKSISSPNRGG